MIFVLRTLLIQLGLRVRAMGSIADDVVEDSLMEERVLRFQAQIVAGLALTERLRARGVAPHDNPADLRGLVELVCLHRLISAAGRDRLLSLNRHANEAKHQLDFISRM